MAYAEPQDMIDRYGEASLVRIADRDGDREIDTGLLESKIETASSAIDSYLGTRYAVPIASPPPLLVNICCDIAHYQLFDTNVLELVKERYQDALKLLRDIANGKATLGITENTLVSSGDAVVLKTDDDRIFTMDKMSGY